MGFIRSPLTGRWRGLLHVAEDVRVAPHELGADVLGDLGEVAGAALLEQQREEVDLEEDVAELVEELAVVAALGGVGELVGLLERVRHDRALVLLAVPRALAAQAGGGVVEASGRSPDLLAGQGGQATGPLPGAPRGCYWPV